MKKRIYISLTYILLVAFVNAIAPKEFLHYFHHHTETEDVYSAYTKIESKHTHCAFLQWQLAGFDAVSEYHLSFLATTISSLDIHLYNSISYNDIEHVFLRGPPAIS